MHEYYFDGLIGAELEHETDKSASQFVHAAQIYTPLFGQKKPRDFEVLYLVTNIRSTPCGSSQAPS